MPVMAVHKYFYPAIRAQAFLRQSKKDDDKL